MSGAEWTEAHQREATVCLLEIARNAALRGDRTTMLKAVRCAALSEMGDEGSFRRRLSGLLDSRVVRREVRRVRRLAEGRLVRETVWQSRRRYSDGSSGSLGLEEADTCAALLVLVDIHHIDRGQVNIFRVTRIRRAP